MRVHADDRDEQKAKAVLVALVEALNARGVRPGRTALYKCFYVAHLLHAKDHGAILSDWPIVKMPRGPGVDEGKQILEGLARLHILTETKVPKEGPPPRLGYEYEFMGGEEATLLLGRLSDEERETIRGVCDLMGGEGADFLTKWSHEFSRAWNTGQPKGELAIYVDLLDDDDGEDLAERLRDARFHLKDVFRK